MLSCNKCREFRCYHDFFQSKRNRSMEKGLAPFQITKTSREKIFIVTGSITKSFWFFPLEFPSSKVIFIHMKRRNQCTNRFRSSRKIHKFHRLYSTAAFIILFLEDQTTFSDFQYFENCWIEKWWFLPRPFESKRYITCTNYQPIIR